MNHQQQSPSAANSVPAPQQLNTPTIQYLPPPQYAYVRSAVSSLVSSFQSRQSMGLGVTLIVLGVMSCVCNAVGIAMTDKLGVIGHGFWCGAMFIITGGFGVAAASHKNRCLIITLMVLSIISAVQTISLLSIGIVGAFVANACDHRYYNDYGFCSRNKDIMCDYVPPPCHHNDQWRVAVAMESCLACFGLIAGIVLIWTSAICCQAICCCKRTLPAEMIFSPQYQNQAIVVDHHQQQQPIQGYTVAGYPYWIQQLPAQPSLHQCPTSNAVFASAPPSYSGCTPVQVAPAPEKDQKF